MQAVIDVSLHLHDDGEISAGIPLRSSRPVPCPLRWPSGSVGCSWALAEQAIRSSTKRPILELSDSAQSSVHGSFKLFSTASQLLFHSFVSFIRVAPLAHSHPFETPPKISQPVNCPETISYTRTLGPELNQTARSHLRPTSISGKPTSSPKFRGASSNNYNI